VTESDVGTLVQVAFTAFFGVLLLLLLLRGYRNPNLMLAGTMVIATCGLGIKLLVRAVGS